MAKEMVVAATALETKVAIVEDDQVTEIFIERTKDKGMLSNIYKGRVTKVLPGMQAAFVDIGLERDAFLYVADFFEDQEEYEHIFSDTEDVSQLLRQEVRQDHIQPDEPRRSRRRTRDRRERLERRASKGSSGTPKSEVSSTPSISSEAVPEQTSEFSVFTPEGEEKFLLPEEWSPGTDYGETFGSEPPGDASAHPSEILPERLEGFEAASREPEQAQPELLPKGDQEESEALPDQDVRLTDKGETQHLAVSKGESRTRRRRSASEKGSRLLIGDLLREGQEILVQVAKEPISKKGARITSHVALAGRYVVFMPTVDHVGVSRRIASDKERQRLKEIVGKLRGDFGKGFIVRTAGEGHSEEDFRDDMRYLTKLWNEIRAKAEKMSAPCLVHSELSLVLRVLRDYFSEEHRAIRVDDEHEYERIVEFINKINPRLVSRVRLYNKPGSIFDEYGVNAEIERALKQKVWLKNGGYIVINQTEALVAIDVNTGKFVGRTASLEDTITKTNLDAVKEVVRQIRLRDLGGIVVIDFIDMDERRNQQRVMDALQAELAKDKAPSKILQFNEFGLVAITRKRAKQSLERILCQPCVACNGTGLIKSLRTVCYSIHQEARKMAPHLGEGLELMIRCHPEVGKALRDREPEVLAEIEEITGKSITLKTDPLMHVEQFDLVEL
ncbi:MAG: Rne/Rng family ribonuclease [Acidobacteria bacterium]|nr:Rne/Rng family ribonuclease [Acidobacteriota bacterium]